MCIRDSATEDPDGIPESFDSQEYLIKTAREDYLHSLEVREEQAALRSATARVQRIRDREMKESPVTPLVENPETGEPLTGTQATVPETDESLQEAATNEPVSYTHLDVYKRQVQDLDTIHLLQ